MLRLHPGAQEFTQKSLINKFTFGLGALGLGALKKMVGGAAEATDRAICTHCIPLRTGAGYNGSADSRTEEHFIFVLQADFALKVIRVDSGDVAHHDTVYSVADHVGLADGGVTKDLSETPHKIHCILVASPSEDGGGGDAGENNPPTVLVCLTLALASGPVVLLLKVQMGVEDTGAGDHTVSLVQAYHGLPDDVVDVKVTKDYVWALCTDDTKYKAARLLYSAVAPSDDPLGWSVAAVDEAVDPTSVEVGPVRPSLIINRRTPCDELVSSSDPCAGTLMCMHHFASNNVGRKLLCTSMHTQARSLSLSLPHPSNLFCVADMNRKCVHPFDGGPIQAIRCAGSLLRRSHL